MDDSAAGWLVVANPVSGRGRALRLRARVEAALRALALPCRFAVSERAGHALELVRQGIAAGHRRILALGGDGTVNEIVSAAFGQSVCDPAALTLAVLPTGTGNDWARGLGVAAHPETALAILRQPRIVRHDVGVAHFAADGRRRHFINVAGVGFDAAVVARMPAEKRTLTYVGGLLGALLAYRALPATLRVDGEQLDTRLFVAFVCLGRYCGGGMRVAPGALPDDGLFDVTTVAALTRLEVLRNLRRLYDGSLLDHPKVRAGRGAQVAVDAQQPLGVEVDGEWAGHTPVRFELLPRALAVVHPALDGA